MIPTAHLSPQPKRHLEQFSRFCTDVRIVSLYFTMGHPFPPPNCPFPWRDLDPHLVHGSLAQLPLPMEGSGPPSSTWFLGPTRVLSPNGISIGAAVYARLNSVIDQQIDRPTDHATLSETTGRIYVCSTVMRPNNNVFAS